VQATERSRQFGLPLLQTRLGQKILEVDAEKYVTSWERDAAGNVIRETKYANKLSVVAAITSDPAALITNVGTNSLDRVNELDYDRMNRVIERRVLNVENGTVSGTGVLTPGTGTSRTQIRYNGLGQITQQTDATGAVSDIGYDVAGRKTKEQGAQFTDFEGALVRPTTDYDGLSQAGRELDRGRTTPSKPTTASPTNTTTASAPA
jgi:YD repeat-containing protein